MATLENLQARRDQLQKLLDSGTRGVRFGSRGVDYVDPDKLRTRLHQLDREIKALEGTKPVRQIRTYATKGV